MNEKNDIIDCTTIKCHNYYHPIKNKIYHPETKYFYLSKNNIFNQSKTLKNRTV